MGLLETGNILAKHKTALALHSSLSSVGSASIGIGGGAEVFLFLPP